MAKEKILKKIKKIKIKIKRLHSPSSNNFGLSSKTGVITFSIYFFFNVKEFNKIIGFCDKSIS